MCLSPYASSPHHWGTVWWAPAERTPQSPAYATPKPNRTAELVLHGTWQQTPIIRNTKASKRPSTNITNPTVRMMLPLGGENESLPAHFVPLDVSIRSSKYTMPNIVKSCP